MDRPQTPLRLEVGPKDNWTLLRLFGELDHSTKPRLDECLEQLVAAGQVRIAVDLSGLELCDSDCLSCFVAVWKRVQEAGGGLILLRPRDQFRRLMTGAGLQLFAADVLPDAADDNGT